MRPPIIAALLLLVSGTSFAGDGYPSPTGGIAGGGFFTGDRHPLESAGTGVLRLGLQLGPAFDIELDIAGFSAQTRSRFAWPYTALDPRINGLYHFNPDQRADVFLGFGGGLLRTDVHRDSNAASVGEEGLPLYANPSSDLLLNVGPGVTIQLFGPVHLRSDLRLMTTIGGDSTPDKSDMDMGLEWTIGLDLRRERLADSDNDGILDRVDDCPDDPEDIDHFQDDDGCPDTDNDADRIPDSVDDCPDDAEDPDGFHDQDGCPDLDNDRDGIMDMDDQCPDQPEDVDGDRDQDGCPEDDLDTDGDGIADPLDECVDEPETINNYQDEDGCPDAIPQEVARFTGVIQGIVFETNSDQIRSSSNRILNQALTVLTDFPDVRLEVQGHTDDQGADAYNLDLSQRRAESVVRWFVEHGIDQSRLEAHGYGETTPIDTNKTASGRQANRRVEFKLISGAL